MSAKIIVGYRTRPVSDVEALMPVFKAPAHWKDQQKIDEEIAIKKANYTVMAKDAPYTGTFDQVFLVDPKHEKVLQWDYHEDATKPPVCLRVRNYLMKTYPEGWSEGGYDSRNPPFRVVGFNPRRFLKILGLECSLPAVNKPLPLKMWYSNAEHRDIAEAILPKDFEKVLDLLTVLKQRRPSEGEARKRWDAVLTGWEGPHVYPEKDATLTVELATQLGFLQE